MAKKNGSLIFRAFVWVVIALLVGLVFVPTFAVNAKITNAKEETYAFSTTVSIKDVWSVAFLSKKERREKLTEVQKLRAEQRVKLALEGLDDDEIEDELNTKSYSKQFALLYYFNDDTEHAVLGFPATTWLTIIAVAQIVMLAALLFTAICSYFCMQYDNVKLPLYNRVFALIAGIVGVLIALSLMICIRGALANGLTENRTVLNIFGYIYMLLSIYLPVHTILAFKKRRAYLDLRNQ